MFFALFGSMGGFVLSSQGAKISATSIIQIFPEEITAYIAIVLMFRNYILKYS